MRCRVVPEVYVLGENHRFGNPKREGPDESASSPSASFTFYDFAWEALQERRETILAKEAEFEAARRKKTRR